MNAVFSIWAFTLVLVAVPSHCRLDEVTVSQTMYLTAVADVINDEFARLAKDVEEFNPRMSDCTKKLNASSDACQACLKTVECGSTVQIVDQGGDSGGRRFKPIDLIHLVNPVDLLKEPLDNIVSKLGKVGGKFVKTVGKHLVKGLKAITGGFDDIVVDGLKDSLRGLKKLGDHLGKAVKGLGKGLGKIIKPVGSVLKKAVKAAGKGVSHVFKSVGSGVKKVVKSVGRGISGAARAIGRGVKSVWRGIKSLFGRRRRSVPTPDELVCMSKCADCKPFLSGDEIVAVMTVCGVDIVNRNVTITNEVALFDTFFNEMNEAELDLLKEVKVNTTSGLLTTVTALVRGQYRTFSTTVKFEALDPASMYKNLAMYIYKNYRGL